MAGMDPSAAASHIGKDIAPRDAESAGQQEKAADVAIKPAEYGMVVVAVETDSTARELQSENPLARLPVKASLSTTNPAGAVMAAHIQREVVETMLAPGATAMRTDIEARPVVGCNGGHNCAAALAYEDQQRATRLMTRRRTPR